MVVLIGWVKFGWFVSKDFDYVCGLCFSWFVVCCVVCLVGLGFLGLF